MTNGVLVIAEAGVNHNGDLDMARELIEAAARAGADLVKFQTFSASRLVTSSAAKAQYQTRTTGSEESQLQMLQRLELSSNDHQALVRHCELHGIRFFSTGFDIQSLEQLRALDMGLMKIPSGEITNLPYLRHIGAMGCDLILSTGMASLEEVEAAILALEAAGTPRQRITVLHCTTEYPAPMDEVNLRAMLGIQRAFDVQVGYSDHTRGVEISIAAAALGATVIEKHFTLDRSLPGPDHLASLEPDELKVMVAAIRNVKVALGDGIKKVTASEAKNRAVARKSLVASCNILKGEKLSGDNMTVKRPGTGISPMRWDEIIGTASPRDFAADELIDL